MRTVDIHPVRLSFFRSDLKLPADQPPYFLLGEYDYLRIDAVEAPSVPDGIAEASVLTSFCQPNSDSLYAEMAPWIDGTVTTGLLVRLDLGVKKASEENRPWVADMYEAAQAVYKNIGAHGCSCLISVGSYSLYVLINLESINLEIATEKLVGLDPGADILIARTTTMPFVSKKVLDTEKCTQVNSKEPMLIRSAEINISCPLFDQQAIINKVDELVGQNKFAISETLGDYDIRIETKEALPLVSVANFIYQIRKLPRVRTLTRISVPVAKNTKHVDVTFRESKHKLEPVSTRNRELLSKFTWISQRIQASFNDKIAELAQADIPPTLELISKELDKGTEYLSNELGSALLDAVIEGFMQRGGHRSLPSKDHDLARTDLAFGAFIPLKAIHGFLEVLHRYIASQFNPATLNEIGLKQDWQGLVVASKSHGFEVFPLSIYLVPYEALLSPCDHDRCWQTLSHELCHVVASGFLQRVESKEILIDHITKLKSRNPGFNIPFEVLRLTLEGDISEVSAHYLDYRFFYQSNFDNYLTAIWATWPQFASELKSEEARYSKYRHYLLRSFAVFVMSQPDLTNELSRLDFSNSTEWIASARQVLRATIREFCSKATLLVRNQEVDNLLLRQEGADALVLSVARLAPLLELFINQINEGVQKEEDAQQPEQSLTEEALKAISEGKVIIDKFNRPEFLVREYHLRLLNQRTSKINVKEQLAMMLTFAGLN